MFSLSCQRACELPLPVWCSALSRNLPSLALIPALTPYHRIQFYDVTEQQIDELSIRMLWAPIVVPLKSLN